MSLVLPGLLSSCIILLPGIISHIRFFVLGLLPPEMAAAGGRILGNPCSVASLRHPERAGTSRPSINARAQLSSAHSTSEPRLLCRCEGSEGRKEKGTRTRPNKDRCSPRYHPGTRDWKHTPFVEKTSLRIIHCLQSIRMDSEIHDIPSVIRPRGAGVGIEALARPGPAIWGGSSLPTTTPQVPCR